MSDYQNEKEKIKQVYLRITNLMATLGLPLSIFLFFAAEDVIITLFGSDWYGSVPTFQILAVSVWIQMIMSSTGGIFQSGNRTDLLLLSGVLSTIFNILGIVTGIIMGEIELVALFLVLAFSLNFIQVNYLLMVRLFESKLIEFAQVLVKPLVLAAMQLIVFLLLPELTAFHFVDLVIKGIIFVLVWFIGLVLTGEFSRLKNEIVRK
jgi:PST family polysaccharide transporter